MFFRLGGEEIEEQKGLYGMIGATLTIVAVWQFENARYVPPQ